MVTLNDIQRFWPYRQAYVCPILIDVELEKEEISLLEEQLNRYGFKLDNHTCFKCGNLYCEYSDHILHIGTKIIQK